MRKTFTSTLAAGAATALVGLTAAGATLFGATAASASTTNGVATIENTGLTTPLVGPQSSTQQFGVALPAGAACSGDTATGGYKVVSYMIPQSVYGTNGANLQSAVTYGGANSNIGLGYFDTSGNELQGGFAKNTAPVSGQVIGVSGPYVWSPGLVPNLITLVSPTGLSASGAYQDGLIPSASASQVWETGIACINTAGQITDWWNAELTVQPSSNDAGGHGYTWTPTASTQGVPESPMNIALPVSGGVILVGGAVVVTRRRRSRSLA